MILILEKGDSEIQVNFIQEDLCGNIQKMSHIQVGDELLRIVGVKL